MLTFTGMLVIRAHVLRQTRLHTNQEEVQTDHVLWRENRGAFRVTSVPELVGYIVL